MSASKQLLTSKEFAERSGLPVAKVTQLLREGGLEGEKRGGKWMIPASELEKTPAPGTTAAPPPTPGRPKVPAPRAAAAPDLGVKSYSVAEFSALTYLTEFGVRDWLKKGRLQGFQAADGEWRIDAASLEAPHIKRLVR
jgi:excisionase family DNA binding protein